MKPLRVTPAVAVLTALIVAAATVIAIELAQSAAMSRPIVTDPCQLRQPFPGHGIDAAIQQLVLDALDGAACRLHTSREQLVLSLRPGAGATHLHWNRKTIDTALRAGLLGAVDKGERRGNIPGLLAPVIRHAVETIPLTPLIQGGITLRNLIG
jgi:hypothetical protein